MKSQDAPIDESQRFTYSAVPPKIATDSEFAMPMPRARCRVRNCSESSAE